jgi:AcrR family transcriptional regulator
VVETPMISRAMILDSALRVADKHGLEAVSVYAVARQLHVNEKVLQRYVDGTDDLLDGLVEVLLTRYLMAAPDGPWDSRLMAMASGLRETARLHPAVFPLLLTRPVITPAARAVRDAVYSALRDSGLAEASLARAERLTSTALLGFAASEAAGRFRMHDEAVIDADFAELMRWLFLALSSLGAAQAAVLQ